MSALIFGAILVDTATIERLSSLLCLALMHFLWQGAAIGIVAFAAAKLLRRRSAQAEYLALLAGILLMPVAFAATIAWQRAIAPPVAPASIVRNFAAASSLPHEIDRATLPQPALLSPIAGPAFEPPPAPIPAPPSAPPPKALNWQSLAPWLVAAYLLGVAAMFVRLSIGLSGARRLARESTRIESGAAFDLLITLCRRIALSPLPSLAICPGITVPTLVGIIWPTVLLPLSAIANLSTAELETILLHELVHIRRRDHLVNLAQRLVEAAFFFHPAVWLLSRRITTVREHCCDDAVLALGAQRSVYIDSLLRVAELGLANRSSAASELIGIQATGNGSCLRRRITRLLGEPGGTSLRLKPLALLLFGLLIAGSLVAPMLVSALPSQTPADASKPVQTPKLATQKDSEGPLRLAGVVTDVLTGKPLAGATVVLVPKVGGTPQQDPHGFGGEFWHELDAGKPVKTRTDADGRYELAVTAAQSANPRFTPTIFAEYPNYFRSRDKGWMICEIRQHQKERRPLWFERIELVPAVPVTGIVLDPDGRPLANCDVGVSSQRRKNLPPPDKLKQSTNAAAADHDPWMYGSETVKTNAGGRFNTHVVPGAEKTNLRVEPSDFAVLYRDFTTETHDFGTLRVDRGTRIVGTVYDEFGKPLAGVQVGTTRTRNFAAPARPSHVRAVTDSHG